MKPRILLLHVGDFNNAGCCMMLQAVLKYVDADFYYHKSMFGKGYKALGIKGAWRLSGYDLAISLGGDSFTRQEGLWNITKIAARLFLLKLFRQRYALLGQEMCNYGVLTPIARPVFRNAALITVRDELSQKLLISYGILGYLTADLVWSIPPDELPPMRLKRHSFHSRVWCISKGVEFPWPLREPSKKWKFSLFNKPLQVECLREKSLENFILLKSIPCLNKFYNSSTLTYNRLICMQNGIVTSIKR